MGWQDDAIPVSESPQAASWKDSPTTVEDPKPSWQASAVPLDHPTIDLIHPNQDQIQPFQMQDTSPMGYLGQIPKLSPGSQIPYDPNAQPTRTPTAQETQQLNALQGSFAAPMEVVTNNPIMWAGRAVAGLMNRAASGIRAGIDSRTDLPALPQEVVNGFMDPAMFQDMRKADQATGSNNLAATAESIFHEIVPPFFNSDVLRPSLDKLVDQNKLKTGDLPDWMPAKTAITDATNALSSAIKIGGGLAVDIATDPISHVILGGLTDEGRAALEASSVGDLGKEGTLADQLLNVQPKLSDTSFAQKVASGEAAMVQLQIPFSKSTIPILRLPGVAKALEQFAASNEMSSLGQLYRSVSMRTGLDTADAVDNASHIEEAGARLKINDFLNQMPDQVDEKINQYILRTAQFGDEDGMKLLNKDGFKYTPDEIDFANQLKGKLTQFQSDYTGYAKNAGLPIGEFEGATTPEAKQAAIEQAQKAGLQVPDASKFGVDGVDGMFTPNRGFRRQLTDQAAAALQDWKEQAGQYGKIIGQAGLGQTVGSQLERAKFSDAVMNEMYGNVLGMKTPFRSDIINMVAEDAHETYTAARNAKFVQAMKDQYGKTIPEWNEAIQRAKLNVGSGNYSAEDVKIANMNLDQLAPLQGRAWNKIQARLLDSSNSADEPIKLLLSQQDLRYPAPVAASIENKLSMPTQNRALATASFLRDTLKQNMLTSMIRIPMHFMEGLGTSVFGLGTQTKYILQEMGDLVRKPASYLATALGNQLGSPALDMIGSRLASSDKLGAIMDNAGIHESIFGDNKVIPKVVVTGNMLDDKNLNYFQNAWMDLIHSKASSALGVTKFFDDMRNIGLERSGLGEKALDYTGRVLQVPFSVFNDNPVANTIRGVGGDVTNIFKRARIRDLVDQGYSVSEAIARSSYDLLDYRNKVNSAVGAASFASPFLNYQLKNAERTMAILMQRPGMWNALNPYDGALERNIQNFGQNGSPRQIDQLRAAIGPLPGDMMVAGFFGGASAVAQNGDWAKGYVNDILRNSLTDKEFAQYSKSPWLGLARVPTNMTALTDFASPMKWDENTGPLMKAVLAMRGVDPYTGGKMKFTGMPDDWFERSVQAINQANPFRAPKLYDALAHTLDSVAPQLRDHYQNGGIDPKAAELLFNVFGSTKNGGQIKLNDEAIQDMTRTSTFDILRLKKADVQLDIQQKALVRERAKMMHDAVNDANFKGATFRIDQMQQSALPAITKQINDNATAMRDYKFRQLQFQKQMGPNNPIFQEPQVEIQGDQQ